MRISSTTRCVRFRRLVASMSSDTAFSRKSSSSSYFLCRLSFARRILSLARLSSVTSER